mgnify:CR=1
MNNIITTEDRVRSHPVCPLCYHTKAPEMYDYLLRIGCYCPVDVQDQIRTLLREIEGAK